MDGLDLTDVTPGEYFLIALPAKIDGAEGAPVRTMLADEYIFWTNRK